ncbi:unnamed protein product [Arctia plantaginis]|uniref:Uncharacterized protein n=2 Tax=Arctia plantaginis TaxID=874455 RepID=A0A8S0ZCR9_ARCPL|nr:unnamed protein product [Arctia plantaginis]CAB3249894.1 unnamed protein product [Arctia plantaginis]
MYKVYTRSQNYFNGKQQVTNSLFGPNNIGQDIQRIHATTTLKFPPAMALKLPTNVDLNATEVSRFSPQRERDISGPVINFCYKKQKAFGKIDITIQADPHANKYDCRGAVSLNSSMQSNVPSPFSGNHTHLNMPGSQWGQGHKYLSSNLQSAHYLTLRNEYRAKARNDVAWI